MAEKLKPCPFCGGKAVLEYSGVKVLCNCERGNIEMAWKVWNRKTWWIDYILVKQ